MPWLISILMLTSISGHAQDSDAEDFRLLIKELNERYEDFFVHQNENKKHQEEILKGINDHKTERENERRVTEQALREWISERKAKPDTTLLEKQDAEQKQVEAKALDQHRKVFVEQRQELKRIRNSARKIPENQDAGLE